MLYVADLHMNISYDALWHSICLEQQLYLLMLHCFYIVWRTLRSKVAHRRVLQLFETWWLETCPYSSAAEISFSAAVYGFCRRSYSYLMATIRLQHCIRFELSTHPVAFARLLRSNLPRARWSCPHGRIRCEQNMNKAECFSCSASLSSRVWKPPSFVVQQVWSTETFNFGSWRYLPFCHLND